MSLEAIKRVAMATKHRSGKPISVAEKSMLLVLADFQQDHESLNLPSLQVLARRCELERHQAARLLGSLIHEGTVVDQQPFGFELRVGREGTGTLPAISRLVKAARDWHEFHAHEPTLIQCDAICEALPAAEAELQAVQQ